MPTTDPTPYADLLRRKVEQVASVTDDLGTLIEGCPAPRWRTHLRNAHRCGENATYALTALAADVATELGADG